MNHVATATIAPALRALMEGLIDYAGLFPPAKLPLGEAIANHAAYKAGADAWMLGRFIIPASRLAELEEHRTRFSPALALDVSALGRGGASRDELIENLRRDSAEILAFLKSFDRRGSVGVLEVKLPAETLQRGEAGAVTRLVVESAAILESAHPIEIWPFIEGGGPEHWQDLLEPVVRGLAEARRSVSGGRVIPPGFKLRCGGVEAPAFPSAANVARAIVLCRDAQVPLKCTAGLHHPIRHHNEGVATRMHGFVNVFGAAVLAHARRLGEREVVNIIECERASEFTFDGALTWRAESAGAEEIRRIRRHAAISFGSCSFDEPREDLASLGLLPR